MFLRLRSKEYGEALLVNTEHIVAIADDRLGRGTLVSCRDQVEYRVVESAGEIEEQIAGGNGRVSAMRRGAYAAPAHDG